MQLNKVSRSETHPGEHAANALRIFNQMVGNLEFQDHHVTVRFLPGLSFQGKPSSPITFMDHIAVAPQNI